MEDDAKLVLKVVVVVFGIVMAMILLFSSFYIINAGQRGVLLTWGKADMLAKTEGLHVKIPLAQKIVKFDVKTQKYETHASAASKDLQVVSTDIALNYHLVPELTPVTYSELGLAYEDRIIQPAVQEVVKAVTSHFTAEELITKRPMVKEQIDAMLLERLGQRDIVVETTSITNFDFSVEFNSAIESKVTAEQRALQAQRDLERIKIEAEQKIAQAQAEAESLRLQKLEITPDLLRLREIEMQREAIAKWDGKLPTYTGGVIPFLNVQGN